MADEKKDKDKDKEKEKAKPQQSGGGQQAGQGDKKGKNILVPILLIFNMVAMLALAGILLYTFLKAPKQESIVDVTTSEDRVKEELSTPSGDGEEEIEGDARMGPTFPLERFIVNLSDKGGNKYLNVVIDLELSSEGLTEEVEKRLPQIRDTILVLLSSKKYDQIADLDGKKRLRDEIMHTINNLLTTGKVKNVYFTAFVVN